ncbi:MAG: hypothetical protein KJ732_01645 [Candidatus Margulisbacteria bacterium]|nr:hypothetical protein [Candidatus Margulisiibacteriota bacterium]
MKKPIKRRKKEIDIHEVLKDVTEKVEKTANVKTVFGDPIKIEDRTIIPVATVSVSDGRGGAGLHVESKPVGYIEITKEGAKFVSTPDSTKIALRGILNGVFAVGVFGLVAIIKAFKKEKKSK